MINPYRRAPLAETAPLTSRQATSATFKPQAPATARPIKHLFAAARLAAPWAFIADYRLTGLDVLAVEHFAARCGSRVHWRICEHEEVPALVQSGRVSLAVGGLSDVLAATPGLHLLRASSRRFSSGEPRHGCLNQHVWVVGDSSLIDRWTLRLFLLGKRVRDRHRGW